MGWGPAGRAEGLRCRAGEGRFPCRGAERARGFEKLYPGLLTTLLPSSAAGSRARPRRPGEAEQTAGVPVNQRRVAVQRETRDSVGEALPHILPTTGFGDGASPASLHCGAMR